MTAREILELMDKDATLETSEGLRFPVTIIDARENFGRIDVEVTYSQDAMQPGDSMVTPHITAHIEEWGSAWVSADRVKVTTRPDRDYPPEYGRGYRQWGEGDQ